jgi:hypothetical protein
MGENRNVTIVTWDNADVSALRIGLEIEEGAQALGFRTRLITVRPDPKRVRWLREYCRDATDVLIAMWHGYPGYPDHAGPGDGSQVRPLRKLLAPGSLQANKVIALICFQDGSDWRLAAPDADIVYCTGKAWNRDLAPTALAALRDDFTPTGKWDISPAHSRARL